MNDRRVVEISPAALLEIEAVRSWWRQNRDKAPYAVDDDLVELVERLEVGAEHVGTRAHRARWLLPVALAACGPSTATTPVPWRECEEALSQVRSPEVPPEVSSVAPIEIGEELPVLRITYEVDDAETLANRTLAAACVMLDGEVTATSDLLDWAERTTAGPTTPRELLLEPTLQVHYMTFSSGGPGFLELGVPVDERPSAPPADGVDAAITWPEAESKAREVIARLRKERLVPDVPHQVLFITRGGYEGHCAEETPECRAEVSAHRFLFAPEHAGIPFKRSPLQIIISNTGRVVYLQIAPVDFEDVGTVAAELTEADAAARLDALVSEAYPGSELHWEEEGRVEYWVPLEGEPEQVEPVWAARFILGNGRPVSVWLPMSDADAPLVER